MPISTEPLHPPFRTGERRREAGLLEVDRSVRIIFWGAGLGRLVVSLGCTFGNEEGFFLNRGSFFHGSILLFINPRHGFGSGGAHQGFGAF
jgi:hypothetical protein